VAPQKPGVRKRKPPSRAAERPGSAPGASASDRPYIRQTARSLS
jgi:hypothetical protein